MTKGELAGRIRQVERVVGTRACRLGRVVPRDVDAKAVGLERDFVGQGGWQRFGVALRNERTRLTPSVEDKCKELMAS